MVLSGMITPRRKAGRPFGTYIGKHPRIILGKATKMYRLWQGMKRRCSSKKSHLWKYYGGRGITVDARWLGKHGFDNFVDDMGPKPSPKHALERVDNAKGYSKENCKWATMKEQCNNRRPKSINPDSIWGKAKLAGQPYQLVIQRLRLGWDESEALCRPSAGTHKPAS